MTTLGRLDSMNLGSNLDYIKDQVDKINKGIILKDEKIQKIIGSLELIKAQLEIQNKIISKIDEQFVRISDYYAQEKTNELEKGHKIKPVLESELDNLVQRLSDLKISNKVNQFPKTSNKYLWYSGENKDSKTEKSVKDSKQKEVING